jgi:two-component system, NarL family, response regulator NreC
MKSRLVLVDDHMLFREGLKSLLREDPRVEIVGEAGNGRDAVRLCRELLPDIVITDVAMPELNGVEATCQILEQSPRTKIIVVSMHSSRRFVVGMLKAGAVGYLLKDCAFQELSSAITAVLENKVYLSPIIAGIVVDQVTAQGGIDRAELPGLTPREIEVLQLLTEGKKASEIAGRLHVSIKTVQTHRRNIMEKLDLHNLADLTKYAIQKGLISSDI